MERVFIISATEKSQQMLAQFLASCNEPAKPYFSQSGAEARRALGDADYDLVLINAPLPDEFGHELAQYAAQQSIAGVLLITKAEISDAVSEKVEEDGVFVLAKPLNRALFTQALRMIRATQSRLSGLQNENVTLQRRIEDIRLVDRAKCVLIECCAMTEPEAHSYIERQAMDRRCAKRRIAEEILHTHEK